MNLLMEKKHRKNKKQSRFDNKSQAGRLPVQKGTDKEKVHADEDGKNMPVHNKMWMDLHFIITTQTL